MIGGIALTAQRYPSTRVHAVVKTLRAQSVYEGAQYTDSTDEDFCRVIHSVLTTDTGLEPQELEAAEEPENPFDHWRPLLKARGQFWVDEYDGIKTIQTIKTSALTVDGVRWLYQEMVRSLPRWLDAPLLWMDATRNAGE